MKVNGYRIGPGTNLQGADLSGASLYGADLYGADLYGADLSGALMDAPDPLRDLVAELETDTEGEYGNG